MESKHGGVDKVSRTAIRAVAMLGVGEVPERLMRCLVNECASDESESNESGLLVFNDVKRKLVNGSSLLSEEAERGSFRLHPLIRQYVRFEASPTAHRLCQEIALRAVHGAIVPEQVEELSTVVSSEQATMRGILTLAPHAVAVVRDQVDAREVTETEEQKLVELTEPVADVTVRALMWSGQAVEADALCTLLLDFLCWGQTERDTDTGASRLMHIFKRGRNAPFNRRKRLQLIANKYRLQRCQLA